MVKKKKNGLLPRIVFDDGMGDRIEITAPSLVTLFQSEKLMNNFDKDPEREYTIEELIDMMLIPCDKGTMRANFRRNELFEVDERIEKGKGGLVTRIIVIFNPNVKRIFAAVKELKKK